ncbi:hypothetical protein [Salmonella enterica]|uniref:hypothetical protein n=1 Tax=Salmonella enterica TaxID=28901 RepID=UPI0013B06ADE|nr:hypothetical protein [Salmonella enterica]
MLVGQNLTTITSLKSHRKDTIGFGGFIGYQFSPWFSLEGGANSLGSVKEMMVNP